MRSMVEGAAAQPPLTRRTPPSDASGVCHLPIRFADREDLEFVGDAHQAAERPGRDAEPAAA